MLIVMVFKMIMIMRTMMMIVMMMMMMMMMMTITVSRRRCHRMKGSMAHQAATASYTTNAFMHTSMMMMMIQSWRRWRRWLPIIIQPGQILTVSEGCELGWGRRWVKMYITPSADLRIWGSEDLRIFPLQHEEFLSKAIPTLSLFCLQKISQTLETASVIPQLCCLIDQATSHHELRTNPGNGNEGWRQTFLLCSV